MSPVYANQTEEKELALKYGADCSIDRVRGGGFFQFELDGYHVRKVGQNPKLPWRTSKLRYGSHNDFRSYKVHATLEAAFEWVKNFG